MLLTKWSETCEHEAQHAAVGAERRPGWPSGICERAVELAQSVRYRRHRADQCRDPKSSHHPSSRSFSVGPDAAGNPPSAPGPSNRTLANAIALRGERPLSVPVRASVFGPARISAHRKDPAKALAKRSRRVQTRRHGVGFAMDATGRGFFSSIRRRSARSRAAGGGGGSRRAAVPKRADPDSANELYASRRPCSPRVRRRQRPEATSLRATTPPGRHAEFDPIR